MDQDRGPFDLGPILLRDLAETEALNGDHRQAIERYGKAIAAAANNSGYLFQFYAELARLHAMTGDLKAAEHTLGSLVALRARTQGFHYAQDHSHVATVTATVLELRGRLAEAEKFWREAIGVLAPFERYSRFAAWSDERRSRLAVCLMSQGRLLEAEVEARKAIQAAASRPGRISFGSRPLVTPLIRILREEGRYREAEALARATIEMYERGGASAVSSPVVSAPRLNWRPFWPPKGGWQEASGQYATIREQMQDDRLYRQLVQHDPTFAAVLINTGRSAEAAEMLQSALERLPRMHGDDDPGAAELRGLLAVSLAARGDRVRALTEFAGAVRVLLERSADADEEGATRPERDQRLRWILSSYIELLTRRARVASPDGDAVAEAFRLAEASRGRFVQRALDATAARSAAMTPALADLIRREQDAARQIGALGSLMAAAFDGAQSSRVVADLRERIDSLQRARQTLTRQSAKEFPA